MKISVITSYTNPKERCDPWKEALDCYESFADEIINVGANWKYEFSWTYFNEIFQNGLEQTNGDWVFRMDVDYFFHENDFVKLRSYLYKYKDVPGLCLTKKQIFTPERFHTKARMCFVLNKKKFPNLLLNILR